MEEILKLDETPTIILSEVTYSDYNILFKNLSRLYLI